MPETPPLAQVETGWTEPAIRERCRVLRDTLHARRVPDPELEAMAPGGADNQTPDPFGAVVVWYALLRARWEQEQARRADEARRAEAALAAALGSASVPVTLTVPGAPRAVHPKSYHALRFCDTLDQALQGVVVLADELEALEPHGEVRALAPLTESLAVRLWAWIVTHPAPDLPFDEAAPSDPPEWTRLLTPEDLIALLEAHLEANRTRITLIAQLFPAERQHESRLSLAGFIGTVSQELGHRPFDLLRRWTLGEVFAQAATASQSAREARTNAEAAARERKAS